jgi:hypothetical protein
MLGYYPDYLRATSSGDGRAGLVAARDTNWPWACNTLSSTKEWFHWASHTGVREAATVASVMLHIAEALWLIYSAETAEAIATRTLPDEKLLATILVAGGGAQWLTEQRAELPLWIREWPDSNTTRQGA